MRPRRSRLCSAHPIPAGRRKSASSAIRMSPASITACTPPTHCAPSPIRGFKPEIRAVNCRPNRRGPGGPSHHQPLRRLHFSHARQISPARRPLSRGSRRGRQPAPQALGRQARHFRRDRQRAALLGCHDNIAAIRSRSQGSPRRTTYCSPAEFQASPSGTARPANDCEFPHRAP